MGSPARGWARFAAPFSPGACDPPTELSGTLGASPRSPPPLSGRCPGLRRRTPGGAGGLGGPRDREAQGAGGWAGPTGATRPRPLAPPLAATERVDPQLRALRISSRQGSRLGSPGRWGAVPRGCPAGRSWAGRGRAPALPGRLTLAPSPSLPRRARTHTLSGRAAPGRDGRGAALQPVGGQLQPGAGRRASLGRLGAAPGPRG